MKQSIIAIAALGSLATASTKLSNSSSGLHKDTSDINDNCCRYYEYNYAFGPYKERCFDPMIAVGNQTGY